MSEQDKTPPTILIIEEEDDHAVLVEQILANLGYGVTRAQDQAGALARTAVGDIVLILLNIDRQDGQATAMTRALRDGLSADAAKLPIIGYTQHVTPKEVTAYFEAGMDDYVNMPLKEAEVESTLDQWLIHEGMSAGNLVWGYVPQSEDNAPDLDVDTLEALVGFMSTAELETLFRQFSDDYETRAHELRDGARDAPHLRVVLHPLVSTAASMGLMKLSAYCRTIMDQCVEDESFTAPDDFSDKLNEYYHNGASALQDHLKQRRRA